jgi:hypothetical protein
MVYDGLLKYIASLTDEEKELYKDLIEDALKRDKELAESFRLGRKNAEKFADNMGRIIEEVLKLQSSLSTINDKLLEVKETSRIVSDMFKENGPCMN